MVTRRSFIASSVASATALVVAPEALAKTKKRKPKRRKTRKPKPVVRRELQLTAVLAGVTVSRPEVLLWEARRIVVASERLKNRAPNLGREFDDLLLRRQISIEHIARDRAVLADAKLRAGRQAMRDTVAVDLTMSGPAAALAAQERAFAMSSIELRSTVGTARGFAAWFARAVARNDERAMLIACPDHYVLDSPSPRSQHVVEVTGGAFLASEFLIDYAGPQTAQIPDDPDLPVRTGGLATGADGVNIGLVKHQFGDLADGGFKAKLSIGFPKSLPSWYITEHRWHLACEFSNWTEAYVRNDVTKER